MSRLLLDLLVPQGESLPVQAFSSFQIPPKVADPDLKPFFYPTPLHGDLSCSFGCIGVLLSVSSSFP